MLINAASLKALNTAFKKIFEGGLAEAEDGYSDIAMMVPSTTKQNDYGWLGKFPGMREWLGERHVLSIAAHNYAIRNKSFEMTVGVDRDDIDDDNIGIYNPLMSEMGRAAKVHPTQLCFQALADGDKNTCYDGQNFFDQDHPVLDANGEEVSVSNYHKVGGNNPRWYLIDDTRKVMPIIYQERRKVSFVAKTDPEKSDHVFDNKEFVYGADYRGNVGYGLWQLCFASNEELTEDTFDQLYDAMATQKGDHGRPLGIKPKILLVPASLRKAATEVIKVSRKANGADNANQDLVKVVVCEWL